MQEAKKDLLFAELTPEESASVNGGYYSHYDRCHRHRRSWVVYRRNCDGSYRRVVRYAYY
jgi:hypothetical protein